MNTIILLALLIFTNQPTTTWIPGAILEVKHDYYFPEETKSLAEELEDMKIEVFIEPTKERRLLKAGTRLQFGKIIYGSEIYDGTKKLLKKNEAEIIVIAPVTWTEIKFLLHRKDGKELIQKDVLKLFDLIENGKIVLIR